jgi:hypothetical protein
MYLAYFDENKYTDDNPYFIAGGILLNDENISELENTLSQIQYNFFGTRILSKDTEMHGKDIFHGKGNCKRRSLKDRVQLFQDIASFLIDNKVPLRLVCIDVEAHRAKYKYPELEYHLGLMLILERFCDYLDHVNDIGIVFGDYEKDEIAKSVLDFSQFKIRGKTPMYFGRPLGRLVDTIYFTHSHHSRFLQVADMIVFLAGRYENITSEPTKWHDKKIKEVWDSIKKGNYYIQHWP